MRAVANIDIEEGTLRKEFEPAEQSRLDDTLNALPPARTRLEEAERAYRDMNNRLLETSELARSTPVTEADIDEIAHAQIVLNPLRKAEKRTKNEKDRARRQVIELENDLRRHIPVLRGRIAELDELRQAEETLEKRKGAWVDRAEARSILSIIENTQTQRERHIQHYIDMWLSNGGK